MYFLRHKSAPFWYVMVRAPSIDRTVQIRDSRIPGSLSLSGHDVMKRHATSHYPEKLSYTRDSAETYTTLIS